MQWSFYLVWQCWVSRIHEYNLSTGSLHIHSVQRLYCCHLCYCLPIVCNTIMHCCWPFFSRHTPLCHTETCGNLIYETRCAAYVFILNKLYVPPVSGDNVIGFHVFFAEWPLHLAEHTHLKSQMDTNFAAICLQSLVHMSSCTTWCA